MKEIPMIPLRMQVTWLATGFGSTALGNTGPGKYVNCTVQLPDLHTCCESIISRWIRMTTRKQAFFRRESGRTAQVPLSTKFSSKLAETHHD